ncbi:MAG: alpha-N-arabinofuranosidase [Ruminococcaceae bacterium]|nr:alpha-N-arabinofuranosidase [Oscillospiraceae bacterium]
MKNITIDFSHSKGNINPNIYGHFSEHIGGVFYDGLWVGEDSKVENIRGFRKSLVESFKKIAPPVLRWPGGCFAETYDWRDGIGPRENRPRRVNWWYHCDHRVEPNHVGTHEFIDFCRMVGAEPYFAANMTTVSPLHIRDWIEYCNFPAGLTTLSDERAANGSAEPFNVQYWGIGNENWGDGGQMTPELCADEYRRFAAIMKSLGLKDLKLILCGANGKDLNWTRRLMKEWSDSRHGWISTYGMSIHYYVHKIAEDENFRFNEDQWYDNIFRADYMREVIDGHRGAMDEFDPQRRIKLIVDEWGNWHRDGSGPSKGYNLFEQQSSMRDAVVAALTLNIFNDRCDIVDMANVAQLCNNLHSLYLTAGENFVETPNYHVFAMYKGHQGGRQCPVISNTGSIEREGFAPLDTVSASASVKDGILTLTMANLNMTTSQNFALNCIGGSLAEEATLCVLAHEDPNTKNTFEDPFAVTPTETTIKLTADSTIELPPASVAVLTAKVL